MGIPEGRERERERERGQKDYLKEVMLKTSQIWGEILISRYGKFGGPQTVATQRGLYKKTLQ